MKTQTLIFALSIVCLWNTIGFAQERTAAASGLWRSEHARKTTYFCLDHNFQPWRMLRSRHSISLWSICCTSVKYLCTRWTRSFSECRFNPVLRFPNPKPRPNSTNVIAPLYCDLSLGPCRLPSRRLSAQEYRRRH